MLLDRMFGEVRQSGDGMARRRPQLSEEQAHVINLGLMTTCLLQVESRPADREDDQTEGPHIDRCPEGWVSEQNLRGPVADRGDIDAVGQAAGTVRIPPQRLGLNTYDKPKHTHQLTQATEHASA